MEQIKIIIRKATRALIKVLYVFPIKKNQIYFESYEGRNYSCNPKYIAEYLLKSDPGRYELVYGFQDPDNAIVPDGIRKVKYKSFAWLKTIITSAVIVQNTTPITYIPFRKNQLVINTWHAGGAYKRTGNASGGEAKELLNWRRSMMKKQINLYLSSSELFTKFNIREAYGYDGRILNCGMPRNDLLFDQKRCREVAAEQRSKYNLGDDFTVLYAPTYRGNYEHSSQIDISLPFEDLKSVLEKRFGKKVRILIRVHYADKNKYQFGTDLIDVTAEPDMQKLLCASDMLITDYSSSIWDFAILRRPCLLYVPDLAHYRDDEKGFFIPFEQWPGIPAENKEELLKAAESFTYEKCEELAEQHLAYCGSFETGKACSRVARIIKKRLDGRSIRN